MRKIFYLSAASLLFIFCGCEDKKGINKRFDDLEARLERIEKLIFPEPEPLQEKAYNITVNDSYYLGNEDAPVELVVFSNFQCPYCAKADEALRDLLEDDELKGKIKIVFKHFPFESHPQARPAAKAALAAGEQGNDKFWDMAEKIFANQEKLSKENYKKWAKDIGLDVARFEKALKENDEKYDELINKDMKMGEEEAKLRGTPWILINGWLLEGGLDPKSIKKMIDEKNLLE